MTILIVDDESGSRNLLVAILMAEGYEVGAADGGDLALETIGVTCPELILLDIRMPETDGFEVCRRLKQNPKTRDIPVIFLSASTEFAERVDGLRLGAVDFITKPFHREELLARVRTHLELSRLRARLEEQVEIRTAELRESEQRFRTMANAAPVMIWASDTSKSWTFLSKRWLDFTGRPLEQELGDGWVAGVHKRDAAECTAKYSCAFGERQEFASEFRLRRSDGEYRWVLNSGVPRFTPDGIFEGFVGSCVDITDLKTTHDRMLASQKLESLGLMAAGVAHDFGNLLATILAHTDLALLDMEADASGRESVETIATVVNHGTGIVKLLMASAGAGGVTTELERVNLSFAVHQILGILSVSISKRATVRTTLADDLPSVLGNVSEIRQIVMNLMTNAIESLGQREGVISVSTDKVRLGEATRSLAWVNLPDGDYVRLSVADNGCGMNAKTRARIFDQFYTTKSEGKGLGLSVVHGIVRSYQGAINVTSSPGKGTTFEILLPCASKATHNASAR